MKHKILAHVFIITVFAATVSLLYYVEVKNNVPAYVETPVHKTAESNLRTYKNTDYGFEIQYSKNYQFQLPTDPSAFQASYFVKSGISLAQISIPGSLYKNTNFTEGSLSMAVRNNTTAGQCQTYFKGSDELELMEDKIKIGKNTFHTAEFSGAAAGTRYDTTLYRIRSGETCYELELVRAFSNIQNFEPGMVNEVNEDEVLERLNEIVETFKLIN
jgi:hypothetical protein